jgi:hypothetical protein
MDQTNSVFSFTAKKEQAQGNFTSVKADIDQNLEAPQIPLCIP